MEEKIEEKENIAAPVHSKGSNLNFIIIKNLTFPPVDEDDEVEVVYQIDENGFLMDEDGNYILDDKGETIKLNEEQIERLRENNLLEEENL